MVVRIIPDNFVFNFARWRFLSFMLSVILILLSFGSFVVKGVNLGIDFIGGMVIECEASHEIDALKLSQELNLAGIKGVSAQILDHSNEVILRFKSTQNEEQSSLIKRAKSVLESCLGPDLIYRKIDYVGPNIGPNKVLEGIIAIVTALAGMFVYLWIRFNWKFSLGGVLGLIHDTIITAGFMSALSIEFNLSSTAAILTIIGYSVNDSVVIFDRVREFSRKYKNALTLMNSSISSTMSRTIMTSATTVLATIPLIVFCTGVVRDFSLIVFFGIVVGTYSSIFVSTSIVMIALEDN